MKTSPSDVDVAFRAIKFISERYHVSLADLEGYCREWRIVWPRWLACFLIRKYTSMPWVTIALLFDRNENSIRDAVSGVNCQVETSPAYGVEVVHLLNAWDALHNSHSLP